MIPKKHVPDAILDGGRISDKIMRKRKAFA